MKHDRLASRDPQRQHQEVSAPAPLGVSCDLCGWPMALPEVCRDGLILGLLVCSQCQEDSLTAQPFTARAEAGLGAAR